MKTDGFLFIRERRSSVWPSQIEEVDITWEGGDTTIISGFSRLLLEEYGYFRTVDKHSWWWLIGATHQVGPYMLHFVGLDEGSIDSCIFRRVRGIFWWVPVVIYRMTRLPDLIYRRMIITLSVWRLADYSSNILPSWRDIYLVKKLIGKTREVKG